MTDIGTRSVQTRSLPASIGGLAAGFMATQIFLTPTSDRRYGRIAPFVDYKLSSSTHGEHSNLFATADLGTIFRGVRQLESFYSGLLAIQEPLGKEFEQVLFENLWELYAR